MDLSFLATPILLKIYIVSVFCYGVFGLMLVQNDQDTTFGRKPLPWANNPKRWVAGALFVSIIPVLNTILAVCLFWTMLFNRKRDKQLVQQYCSKWGNLS